MARSCASSASKRVASPSFLDCGCSPDEDRTAHIRRSWFITLLGCGILLMCAGATGMVVASASSSPGRPEPHAVTHITQKVRPPLIPQVTTVPAAAVVAPRRPGDPTPRERIENLVKLVALERKKDPTGLTGAHSHLEAAVTFAREQLPPKDMRRHKLEALMRAYGVFERAGDTERMATVIDRLVPLLEECASP